jgi:hypothetical protein
MVFYVFNKRKLCIKIHVFDGIQSVNTILFSCILNRPTINEHRLASRIVNVMDNQEDDAFNDPLVRTHLKKKLKWTSNLIVHYTDEVH